MDKILIGSKAIKHWYSDFSREPKDIDYAVLNNDVYKTVKGIEYLPNPILIDLYQGSNKSVLEPNHLLTLKASHLCWNINWAKHMYDVQFLLKKGHVIDKDLFFNLYHFWNKYHSKNKRSDLKMTKEEFFTNAINYDTCEHDDLHKIINPVPMYTLVLKDNCEVELDKNKFYALSHQDKIRFVQEEVMVMAWERYRSKNYRVAFDMMLKKFIINHCPLFALLFTIENYLEILKININYIKQINHELGTIKRGA